MFRKFSRKKLLSKKDTTVKLKFAKLCLNTPLPANHNGRGVMVWAFLQPQDLSTLQSLIHPYEQL